MDMEREFETTFWADVLKLLLKKFVCRTPELCREKV
jgi:hypothetical protein